MAKRVSPELQTDRPTHVTDFFATDVDKVKFYDDQMTDNIVTAILLDYRAYDTLGEASVLFCAVLGVAAILRRGAKGGAS